MAKTLLLADASVTIQRVMELTFAHEDVRVVAVPDGRKAIQWLGNERADIVMADVDLPETDGYALTAYVRRTPKLQKVPVLLLAGAFEPIDHDRVKSAGADGVIVKPFEPQHVVTRVRELLATPQPEPVGVGAASRSTGGGTSATTTAPGLRVAASTAVAEPAFAAPQDAGPGLPKLEPLPPVPERLEIPATPLWSTGAAPAFTPAAPLQMQPLTPAPLPQHPPAAMPQVAPAPPQPAPKVSLVNAFSALLAAEQSVLPAPPPAPAAQASPAVTEASVEDAVRKALVKMTDEYVRRIVLETAERLIKEEIEKIKTSPE
jgi:CheY-like chemotaxis protein